MTAISDRGAQLRGRLVDLAHDAHPSGLGASGATRRTLRYAATSRWPNRGTSSTAEED